MNEIKTLTVRGFTLTHSWYIDFMGLQRNAFDLFDEETRTHYPLIGGVRVSDYDRGTLLTGDDISPYTDEQYLEMLNREVRKIQTHE